MSLHITRISLGASGSANVSSRVLVFAPGRGGALMILYPANPGLRFYILPGPMSGSWSLAWAPGIPRAPCRRRHLTPSVFLLPAYDNFLTYADSRNMSQESLCHRHGIQEIVGVNPRHQKLLSLPRRHPGVFSSTRRMFTTGVC